MKWLYLLCLTILTEASQRHLIGGRFAAANSNASVMVNTFNRRMDSQTYRMAALGNKPTQRFTSWSRWSECRGGHRTRRKHCLLKALCGDSLRIEVGSCRRRSGDQINLHKSLKRTYKVEEIGDTSAKMYHLIPDGKPSMKRMKMVDTVIVNAVQRRARWYRHLVEEALQTRQMIYGEEIQKRFRGFSPWSPWSTCSRKCTTVRRRYCRRPAFCGRRVVRQSAYCYVEGGFCQRWIRGRMQRRKDPGNVIQESMPVPALAIHPEDDRTPSTAEPTCGKLGRYHGADRTRARMREMVRIIGGRPAAPGKWPWQVAVLNRYKEAFCGGTLVSLRWVVTAAHCVRKRLYVRLGEHDLMLPDRGEIELKVQEAVVHPLYDPDTVVNDVAMLRLPEAARPSLGHGVACLPRDSQPLAPHASCVILGWGKRRATDVHGTRILHEAQVSTIQQGVCRRSYWQYAITDNMVCAGRGRRDSCAGDSGGPLLCRDKSIYYLQGITSFGDGCGKRGKYGIYTRTAGYVGWIKHIMAHKYFDD